MLKYFYALVACALVPLGALAHTMSPGYQKVLVPGDFVTLTYEVGNSFDIPATYEVYVLAKDFKTVEEDWRVIGKNPIKLFPGDTRRVRIKFRMPEGVDDRKVIVCSALDAIGYNDENPQTITRVCSRLWLWR